MTRTELTAARPVAKPGEKPNVMKEVGDGDHPPSYIEYHFTKEEPGRLFHLIVFYPEELDARAAYAGWKTYGKEVKVDHGGGSFSRHIEIDDVPFPVQVSEGTMMIQIFAQLPGMPPQGE